MCIFSSTLASKKTYYASEWRSFFTLAAAVANVYGLTLSLRWVSTSSYIEYPFELPEPLSDKSTFVHLDLTVLSHIFIVKHPGPNHELVIRSSHISFLLSTSFPPLFHLQRVHRSLAIGSGLSLFTCNAIEPPPSHTDALSLSPSLIIGRNVCGDTFHTCVHPSSAPRAR